MIGVLSVPKDYTWDIVEQFHWSYLEVNLGILCASVPALQPFVKQYLGPIFSSELRNSKEESNKQPEPYSTAVGRNAERREAKLNGYEMESRDDRSEDGPFMLDATDDADELQLWRRGGAQHKTGATTERSTSNCLDSDYEGSVDMRFQEVNPQGISVQTETAVKYNA